MKVHELRNPGGHVHEDYAIHKSLFTGRRQWLLVGYFGANLRAAQIAARRVANDPNVAEVQITNRAGRVVDVLEGSEVATRSMVPTRRLHRPNPLLTVLGNPGSEAVQTFSTEVVRVSYVHTHEPEAGDVIRDHDFAPGCSMTALKDGRVVLWRQDGRPVWSDDGRGDRR